jgi:hypothetical protein
MSQPAISKDLKGLLRMVNEVRIMDDAQCPVWMA